ncbi:MAG: hypothetical protein K0B02_01510 [DPANN group archaeon]|nr:hypothetical protein [DPANN group archaeon]
MQNLNIVTGYCSLGESEVETVLRYFVGLAKQVGNFVGFLEEEMYQLIND